MSYGPPTAISASPRDSVSPEVKVSAGNRLPSPGKVKKAVSKPATDLENGSPPFRVKKGVGALRHKPYYSSNSVSSPPQGKEQSTHEQVLNSNGTRG
ncbi:unnamed protein product [Prunus armeniaca]|uniref:Uncharacterized protein n=1 Tax=Prunus armeniaca TaxID=36596 RepID=A0A6J5VDJ9_PRUAR|nr:unnamed protein product [Prunus armeniaca]